MIEYNIIAHNPEMTEKIAAQLARYTRQGDCVALNGDLGAGKTQFARGFIKAHAPLADVTSPTFTLVQTYPSDSAVIWHFDLYRLEKAADIFETGMDDALRDGITLIEWPDMIADSLPETTLRVQIAYGQSENERLISFTSLSNQWNSFFESLGKYVSAA